MKTYIQIILFILSNLVSHLTWGEQKVLNIYAWGECFPHAIIQQFTKETGIKVNINEYDNNETMFIKIKASPDPGYDIVVPSSYSVKKMIKHNLLYKLNRKKLPNFRHLEPMLLKKEFDPDNSYSVPFCWGTTGIIINTKYIKSNQVTSWRNFWETKYRNKIMLLNDMRDVFSMALLTLGYSINDTNPKHLHKAYLKLKKLRPNIKIFSVDTVPNIYIDEDVIIGMIWSSDYKRAYSENPHLKYIYPQEGFPMWIENIVILKTAPHVENAHKFINFILRPKIAKQITLTLGHITANNSATKLMSPAMQRNSLINPSLKLMRYCEIQHDLNDKTRLLYEKYWEKLKVGG